MRGILLSLAFVTAAAIAAPQAASAPLVSGGSMISAAAADLQSVPKDVNIDINVNRGGGTWYKNPLWVGIGALAVIMLLLLIVLAARGSGGTTIVKD